MRVGKFTELLYFPAWYFPYRQSVRARASMRVRPIAAEKSPLSMQLSSPLAPIPPNRPYNPPTPPKPTNREYPSTKLGTVDESVSPEHSDSDPDDHYLNISFQQATIAMKKRAASQSGSESSTVSEDGSLTGAGAKRPVATPRTKSLVKKGGHTVTTRSHSAESSPLPLTTRSNTAENLLPLITRSNTEEDPPPPPLPPRPNETPKIPLRKYNSVDILDDPPRPKLRPRMSEIKRAKDRARAAKVACPALKIVNEDGLETMSMTSARSSQSTSSKVSSKSTPNYGGEGGMSPGGRKIKKRSLSTDQGVVGTKPQHLAPERPLRQRRKSEGEGERSPTTNEVKVPGEAGGLNTQIADTLLRFIITSEDPSLKAALRDLITQDSNVVSSISEQ